MESGEFEILTEKVEQVVARLGDLRKERDSLQTELHAALERAGSLEKQLTESQESTEGLRRDLASKSENISVAGERIRGLVSRLETALA